jgi:hypothetical protein
MLDHNFLVNTNSLRDFTFSQWYCSRFLSSGTRSSEATVVWGEVTASTIKGVQEETLSFSQTIVSVSVSVYQSKQYHMSKDLNTEQDDCPWFQASAAMLMTSALLRVITQRRIVILYRRFGKTYPSHLQGSRSPRRKESHQSPPTPFLI